MEHIKAYHFCDVEFFKTLTEKVVILADRNREGDSVNSDKVNTIYSMLYDKINNGNPMFFMWRDNHITPEISVNCEDAKYLMLEMDIPRDSVIEMDFDNWCSFIADIDEYDNLEEADKYCRGEGIIGGLKGSLDATLSINETSRIQLVAQHIDLRWVSTVHCVNKKIISI